MMRALDVFRLRCAYLPARIAAVLIIFIAVVASVYCQTAISTTGISGLAFGSFARSSELSVNYSSSLAARFRISGDTASNVRITISVSNLSTPNGASSGGVARSIGVTITNSDCAYSLDGGATWNTFSSGALSQETRFPADPSGRSSIEVRVGGSINSGARQQRGNYSGSVTIAAEYR